MYVRVCMHENLCVHCIHSVQMVAKGKDCADLFPAVVKNVVSKNSEVHPLLSNLLTLPPPSPSLFLSLPPLLFPPPSSSSCLPFTFHCVRVCFSAVIYSHCVFVNIKSLWLDQVTTLFETISLAISTLQYCIVYREYHVMQCTHTCTCTILQCTCIL